jgi:GxxExxY protein
MTMREVDEITAEIVDAAYHLHRRLGPGLMESVYSSLLAQLLEQRGLRVEREKRLTFEIDGLRFEDGLRLDLLVDGRVIVELKSVEKLGPVHSKQLLTYLRVLDLRVGLLINFGAPTLKEGIQRVVNAHRPSHASPLRLNQGIG